MKIIQKVRKIRKYLVFLVLTATSLMMTGIPVQAEETAAVKLSVVQTFRVTGSSVSEADGIFTYKLTAMDAMNPMPAGSTSEGYQFSLNNNQRREIGSIAYSLPGTYEYQMELVIAGGEKTGYTYDKEVYFITVYVKNTENNALVTEVIAKNTTGNKVESLNFAHSYQPLASDPALMVDPPVKKTVSGSPSSKGTFKFSLVAEKKTNPMPEGSADGKKTMTILGEGEAEFGVWPYISAGTYHYMIVEEDTGETGYSYDQTVYTITDVVDDKDGQLTVARTVTNNDKKQVDSCAFKNQYSAGGSGTGGGTIPNRSGYAAAIKTGDTTNIAFWAVLLIVAAISILVVVKGKRKKA